MIDKYLQHLMKTAEENYISNMISNLQKLDIKPDKFLDIGCYTGDITIRIQKALNIREAWGIEVLDDAIKKAKKLGIKTIKQDLEEPEWRAEENSFDFVFSNQVIEHLYSVDNFIINIKRILKPDGLALISTENLSAWHNVFALFLGYQPFSTANICTKKWTVGNKFSRITAGGSSDKEMTHRAVFTLRAFKEFAQIYDFEIVREILSGYYPFPNSVGNKLAKIDPYHSVYMALVLKNKK